MTQQWKLYRVHNSQGSVSLWALLVEAAAIGAHFNMSVHVSSLLELHLTEKSVTSLFVCHQITPHQPS